MDGRDDYRDRDRTNWGYWLLLLGAFVLGWVANAAFGAANQANQETQTGVGGGPGTQIVSPSPVETPNNLPNETPEESPAEFVPTVAPTATP